MPSKPSNKGDVDYLLEDGGLVPLIDEWVKADPSQSWDYLATRVAEWCRNKWRPSGPVLEYTYARIRDGAWVPGREVIGESEIKGAVPLQGLRNHSSRPGS